MGVKTTYFGDATLLLAGGGVGALAFAGACLAAEARGCRFHAAAATSFGAIVAALVAAGCSGRELVRAVHAISRRDLLGRAEPSAASAESRTPTAASSEPPSSETIQHWLNGRLRAKLGIAKPVVTFADLPRPLVVMAVDLRRGQARTWSRASDPDMPVGLAVRCACADPFRLAPIEVDGQLLADGNLLGGGWFDQIDARTFERRADLPALVFRLTAPDFDDPGPQLAGAPLARRIGDIVATRVAAPPPGRAAPWQDIDLPVGSLSPADLALTTPAVRRLVRAGFDAATRFLANEKAGVADSGYVTRRLDAAFHPGLVEQTMIALGAARRDILIAGGDLSWAWELFPSLALKACEGVSIRIVCTKPIDPAVSAILAGLGCDVRRSGADSLTYGTFIDAHDPDGTAILVKLQDGRLRGGVLLGNRHASGVVPVLIERLDLLWRESLPLGTATQPEFEPVAWGAIEEALRAHVAPYRDAQLALSPVAIEDLLPLTPWLDVARLRRAEAVAELYRRCEQPLFAPMRQRAGAWCLAPPVVETVDGRWAVIGGLHRIYHCRNRGIASIQAVVVRGAGDPPPANILPGWQSVCPLPYRLAREDRYAQYVPSRWRDLRSAWTALAHHNAPDRPASQAARYPSTLPQS